MLKEIAARTPQTMLLLAALSSICFLLLELSPVDPARSALTAGVAGVEVSSDDLARKRVELGLDRPLLERYAAWWGDLARLDLGESYLANRPVAVIMGERVINSLLLAGVALLMSVVVAIPVGLLAAVRAGTWWDSLVRVLALTGASMPAFWFGLMALWLFAVELGWFPAIGRVSPAGIVLPAMTLALVPTGRLVRLVRAVTLDVLRQEYVTVARAKGVAEWRILRAHVLPNVMIPLLSVIGLDFGLFVGGAVVVESVFSWPGIGRTGASAAFEGDLPVVLAFLLVTGTAVILANLVVDLLVAAIDPRDRVDAG